MRNIIFALSVIASTTISCMQSNEFYNPGNVYNIKNIIKYDTLKFQKCYEVNLLKPYLYSIDDYLIIKQARKDSVFTILNMEKDSFVTTFGEYGHAVNEFIAIQPWIYACRGEDGTPLLYVPEVKTTKVIDLKKSIKENRCVVRNIIKEKSDMLFFHKYHIGKDWDFIYKTVSYEDARDKVYVQPEFSMEGKEKYSWEIYPNIITPAFSNLMDGAYANKIIVKPDRKKIIETLVFIDLTNIFDLETKKTIGIKGEDSYTFDYINSSMNEQNVRKELRMYNLTACASDKYFILLKDGGLCEEVARKSEDEGFSIIHLYDWDGNLKKAYVLDRDIYEIAYHEKSKSLYCLGNSNKLYKYQLSK